MVKMKIKNRIGFLRRNWLALKFFFSPNTLLKTKVIIVALTLIYSLLPFNSIPFFGEVDDIAFFMILLNFFYSRDLKNQEKLDK
jgi:uncharacterized membrane protein YkvA (DUF1232 family)